jgi:hypothetical protein
MHRAIVVKIILLIGLLSLLVVGINLAESKVVLSVDWAQAQQHENIIYFPEINSYRILRYDAVTQTWISELDLSSAIEDTISAIRVDSAGLLVASGTKLFLVDENESVSLVFDASAAIAMIYVNGDYAYLALESNELVSINKQTGQQIDLLTAPFVPEKVGDVAESQGWLFVASQSDQIGRFILSKTGQIDGFEDADTGGFNVRSRLHVSPNDNLLFSLPRAGQRYASDYTYFHYSNSEVASDDLVFIDDILVSAFYNSLTAYSNRHTVTGVKYLEYNHKRIFVYGNHVFAFAAIGSGLPHVTRVSLSELNIELPNQPIGTSGLEIVGGYPLFDTMMFDGNDTVFLYSRRYGTIYSWKVSSMTFAEPISIFPTPADIAYRSGCFYLSYPIQNQGASLSEIRRLCLDTPQSTELVAKVTGWVQSLAAGENFVIVTVDDSTLIVGFDGTLISTHTRAKEVSTLHSGSISWDEDKGRLYVHDLRSRELLYEEYDEDGNFVFESPYVYADSSHWKSVVSPESNSVIAGLPMRGTIYEADTLSEKFDLSEISIADWVNAEQLLGLRLAGANLDRTDVQWIDSDGSVVPRGTLAGSPAAVVNIDDGAVTATLFHGALGIQQWNADGELVYGSTLQQVFLPKSLSGYCGSPIIDDFSDPNSGWPTFVTEFSSGGYEDGHYRITHNEAYRWLGIASGDVWQDGDELFEVEGWIPTTDGRWGILIGLADDWSHFYTFEILPENQIYEIWEFNSETGWKRLAHQNNFAINQGSQKNRLSMSEAGLAINNVRLPLDDSSLTLSPPGRVGILAISLEDDVDFYYDNYIFVRKNCPVPSLSERASGTFPVSGVRELSSHEFQLIKEAVAPSEIFNSKPLE